MRRRTPPARIASGLVLTVALSAAASPVTVRHDQGRLSLHARDAPVSEVLSAIAKETGIKFVVDRDLKPGPILLEFEATELERAIRRVVAAIPEAAGHSMSYSRGTDGRARLELVMIFGPGKTLARGEADVYEVAAEAPTPYPTPDLEERKQRMIEAGVAPETAEKVIELTLEVQRLQATPLPGSYKPDDLSAASREQLGPLIDRGVPIERAVQMLLLQERYQETLKELSKTSGAVQLPGVTAPESSPTPAE